VGDDAADDNPEHQTNQYDRYKPWSALWLWFVEIIWIVMSMLLLHGFLPSCWKKAPI
jgi:hypothetical protein